MNEEVSEDYIAAVARATAERLAPDFGEQLLADVEDALHAPASPASGSGPTQYDWVSVGGLIVSVTTFAYTIYKDMKKSDHAARPEVLARTLHAELKRSGDGSPASDKIIELTVQEIVYGAGTEENG